MGRKKSDSFASPPKQRSPIKKLKLRRVTTPERTVYEIIPSDSTTRNEKNCGRSRKWSSNVYGLEDSYSEKSDDDFGTKQKSTKMVDATETLIKKMERTNLNPVRCEKLDFQGLEESLDEGESPIQEEKRKKKHKKKEKKLKKNKKSDFSDSENEGPAQRFTSTVPVEKVPEKEVENDENLNERQPLKLMEKMEPSTMEPNVPAKTSRTKVLQKPASGLELQGSSIESNENERPKIVATRKRRSTAPEPDSSFDEDDRPFEPLPTGNVAIKLVPIARTHAPKYLEMTPDEFSRILPWLRDKT